MSTAQQHGLLSIDNPQTSGPVLVMDDLDPEDYEMFLLDGEVGSKDDIESFAEGSDNE